SFGVRVLFIFAGSRIGHGFFGSCDGGQHRNIADTVNLSKYNGGGSFAEDHSLRFVTQCQIMIAPIILQEMQVGSRQGRFAVFRCIYAGWLLVQLLFMAFVHWIECMLFAVKSAEIWAGFGTAYYRLFLGQHFLLLVLATPLLAGGAITDEKVRGTL